MPDEVKPQTTVELTTPDVPGAVGFQVYVGESKQPFMTISTSDPAAEVASEPEPVTAVPSRPIRWREFL